MRNRLTLVATAAVLGLLAAACSGNNSVGSGVNLNAKGGSGALSLGSSTTSASGPVGSTTTTAPPRPTATTAAPATTTTAAHQTAAQSNVYVIHIESDSSGQPPFNPPNVAVYAGTPVEWVNTDSKPHSVAANDGAFSSPMIAPGATWTWTATTGRHDYADGTRPYAVGTVEVVAR